MKTKEELNALKEEVEKLNKKLAELSDEELEQVSGGEKQGYVRTLLHANSATVATYADLGKATDSAEAALCDDKMPIAESE